MLTFFCPLFPFTSLKKCFILMNVSWAQAVRLVFNKYIAITGSNQNDKHNFSHNQWLERPHPSTRQQNTVCGNIVQSLTKSLP